MKVTKAVAFFGVLMFTLFNHAGNAKVIGGYLNNYAFYSTDNKPYVETVVQIDAQTIRYKPTGNKQFSGRIEITILYYHDTIVLNHYRYLLNTIPVSDTLQAPDIMDMKRVELPTDVNRVEVLLGDENNAVHYTQSIVQEISIKALNGMGASDIELVDHYKPEQGKNVFVKNGYEIVPRTIMSFGSHDSAIIFYAEFYHLASKVNEDVTITYSINNALNNTPVLEHGSSMRQKPQEYNVLFNKMDITDLAAGKYLLNISVYDGKGTVLVQSNALFRKVSSTKNNLVSTPGTAPTGIFAQISEDSLDFYLQAIYYTIGQDAKPILRNCFEGRDVTAKRIGLRDFWVDRYHMEAEKEFLAFRQKVLYVERTYSAVKKHGFRTDRGRVYLQYGPPDYIEPHHRDIGTYPYDIWQYYHLDAGQNGVIFVFYSRDMISENYILIHSSAMGEVNNTDWTRIVSQSIKPSMIGTTPSNIR